MSSDNLSLNPPMGNPLTNFIGFQIGWLVAVLGAARGYPFLGPVYALIWLWLHIRFATVDRAGELIIVVGAMLVGFVFDSLLVLSGVIAFPPHTRLGAPTTLWMLSLWAMFASTLRHSMGWLINRYVLGMVLGAVFGPVAYWAGERLAAIELIHGSGSLLWVAVEWGVAIPALLFIAVCCRPAHRRTTNDLDTPTQPGE